MNEESMWPRASERASASGCVSRCTCRRLICCGALRIRDRNMWPAGHLHLDLEYMMYAPLTSYLSFLLQSSDADLPVCSPNSVCNKIDTYGTPWVEKQCRCPSGHQCSTSTHPKDGRTVVDRTRLYKVRRSLTLSAWRAALVQLAKYRDGLKCGPVLLSNSQAGKG